MIVSIHWCSCNRANTIHDHAGVAECAVFGVPDETWGERVHAVVRLKPGGKLEETDLIEHCRAMIAGYKCPRSVEFRTDPLPQSGPGKILKAKLREPYWSDRDKQVN